MNLAEVDQEILREPTLYYWEVPGVAAGYRKTKKEANTARSIFRIYGDTNPWDYSEEVLNSYYFRKENENV